MFLVQLSVNKRRLDFILTLCFIIKYFFFHRTDGVTFGPT